MNDPKGILDEVKKAVVGKDGVLVMALLAILAGGHILLEDIPGVGKTTMALAFSKVLSLKYNRVQFTPDVLPSDIVGFSVYNKATGAMEYKDGAILCNLFLADELNRATSGADRHRGRDHPPGARPLRGHRHPEPRGRLRHPALARLPDGPVHGSAVPRLPQARRREGDADPQAAGEPPGRAALHGGQRGPRFHAQGGGADLRQRQDLRVHHPPQNDPAILQGASPRASLAVTSMSKAAAWVQGRDYVLPADVKLIYPATVAHRIILTPDAEAAGRKAEALVENILKSVSAPVAK